MKKIIIVGGGTAGAIIAKKLAANFEVLIFEKSQKANIPLFNRIPLLIGLLLSKRTHYVKKIFIKFNSERYIPFFESCVWGGASAINGCVHVMGSSFRWARLLTRFEFNLCEFEDSYKGLYSKSRETNKLSLSENIEKNIDSIFFHALEKKGIFRGNVEWAEVPAFGPVINTVGRVFRSSVMSLGPFRNSKIKSGAEVERLVVDDHLKIIGVIAGDKIYLSDAVIISAGVVGTNRLLMKKALLLSDNSLVDLGLNVGKDIKDHTNLRVNVSSEIKINSLNEINSSVYRKVVLFYRHLTGNKTLMMGTGATSAAHLDLDGDGQVDTRIQLLYFSEVGRMGSHGKLFSSNKPGFSISITPINPSSNGQLLFDGDAVHIEPNYLKDQLDIDHLKKALDYVVKILEMDSFRNIIKEIYNSEQIKNNPIDYIKNNTYSGYHLIGGCGSIVNTDFQVKGFEGLFICDASILMEYVSSNIHSTIVILADLFAGKFTKKFSFK